MPNPAMQAAMRRVLVQTVAVLAPSAEQLEYMKNNPDADVPICGSGYIYTAKGDIITNHHVIANASPKHLEVMTSDGKRYPARLVGSSPQADVAVLRIKPFPGMQPVTFADSDKVQYGDNVFAVGAPRALEFTLTSGIISHPERFDSRWQKNFADTTILPVLQTDAAVNPGNSGGALFNEQGEVVGMNTFIYTPYVRGQQGIIGMSLGSSGLNFSLKINGVKNVADKLIKSGATLSSNPGFRLVQTTGSHRSRMEYAPAVVDVVSRRSPACRAGLKAGDRLTTINGAPVAHGPMAQYMLFMAAGAEVTLTVTRLVKGAEKTVTLSFDLPLKAENPDGAGNGGQSLSQDQQQEALKGGIAQAKSKGTDARKSRKPRKPRKS